MIIGSFGDIVSAVINEKWYYNETTVRSNVIYCIIQFVIDVIGSKKEDNASSPFETSLSRINKKGIFFVPLLTWNNSGIHSEIPVPL